METTAGPEAKELEPDLLTASELAHAFTDGVQKRRAARTTLSYQVAMASPIEQLLRSLDLCKWSPSSDAEFLDGRGEAMSLLHGPLLFSNFVPRMRALTSLSPCKFRGLVTRSTTCFVGQDRGSDRLQCST